MAVQNNGGEFQEYQSAQNQLLNIQAQQMQNLNEQRVMAQADASTNNVLYQASGLMADNMMNNTQEAANFNPQTQAILNQYGLGQPRMQRSSSSSSQSTSKQNITINNNYKTENTTTNNVTVPSGGPIQGRPVTIGDNGIGKFKVWLNTTFSQQQEAAAKRDREYEIRQSSLSKENNKILRKLETVGTNVGKALDPRRVTQAIQNPMKMLLTTLGIVTIAQNFPKIVDFVDKVQNFTKPGGTLVRALGGNSSENIGEAFVNLFFDKETGLIAPIKQFIKDAIDRRRQVIKEITLPNVDLSNPSMAIKEIGNYLGNIIKAIIDPGHLIVDNVSETVSETANKNLRDYQDNGAGSGTIFNENKNQIVRDHKGNISNETIREGDRAVVNNNFSGIPRYAIDEKTGNLSGSAGSTIANGNELVRLFDELNRGKDINPTAITEALVRFANVIESGQKIIIGERFKNFLKDTFNLDVGTKTPEGEYVYVAREGGPNNELYYQLVNKNNIKKADLSLVERDSFGGYYDDENNKIKPPENLYEVSKDELMKIVSSISGKREKVDELGEVHYIDFSLDDIKNTNKYLQEGTLKYVKKINQNANLDQFYNDIFEIEKYNATIDRQKENYTKIVEGTRYHKAKQNFKKRLKLNINDNIKMAMSYFTNELGMSDAQAAAFVANLMAESSLDPTAEGKDKSGKVVAEGIAQWTNTGNRRKNLLDLFNAEYNTSYKSVKEMPLDDQLKLLGLELTKGSKSEFFKKFISGYYANKEGIDAVEAVLRGFEFGGNGALASRNQVGTTVFGADPITFDDMYLDRLEKAKSILDQKSSWAEDIYDSEKATDIDESSLEMSDMEKSSIGELAESDEFEKTKPIAYGWKKLDDNTISSNNDDNKFYPITSPLISTNPLSSTPLNFGISKDENGRFYRTIAIDNSKKLGEEGFIIKEEITGGINELKQTLIKSLSILDENTVNGNKAICDAILKTNGPEKSIHVVQSYTE